MPLSITHKEGTIIELHYQNTLVATLTVAIVKKLRTKNKEVEFMFKEARDNTPAVKYTISGQERVRPMANSPFPMNKLEIYVNQERKNGRRQISLYYEAPRTLKFLRRD